MKPNKKVIPLFGLMILLSFCFCMVPEANAQRRQRPGSMKHSEEDVENMRRMDPVKCTYIKNGSSFKGDVYATGLAGRIKIGTSTLTLSNGHYTLNFKAGKFETRDVLRPQEKGRFNPWRKEKLMNDFVQKGKFSTFKKAGQTYLRLYVGDSDDYITDVPLSSADVKNFKIDEDGLLFEYQLY